jgi:hypothetical protein
LTKLLADNAPKAMKEQKFESYFGRKIAVDASMSIYQFLVCSTPTLVLISFSSRCVLKMELDVLLPVLWPGFCIFPMRITGVAWNCFSSIELGLRVYHC